MKVVEKVSWLMGRVQENLFPHLNQCLKTPLTAQEERLVSILEIVQVERHVPKAVSRYRWPGRNPHDRQSLARAFVAKALYRHPTTSDSIRALTSAENLRRICGFMTTGDIPSESTFSRAFAEFAASSLGNRVHDALVEHNTFRQSLSDTSAGIPPPFLGARNRRKERSKNRRGPARGAVPPKASNENLSRRNVLIVRFSSLRRKPSRSCQSFATGAPRRMPRGTKRHGTVTSCTWTQTIRDCRSVPWSPLLRCMTVRPLFR